MQPGKSTRQKSKPHNPPIYTEKSSAGLGLDLEPKSYILNWTENFGMTKMQTDT